MGGTARKIKIGIIGGGWVTENRHLPALQGVAEAEVVALAEIDAGRLKQVAEKFKIPRRYSDFNALLSDPNIEVVAVCVPTQFHHQVVLASLDAGKHVLVEKPLARDLQECDQLIARASRLALKAMVGFNLRRHPLIRQARNILQSGKLGRVKATQSVFTSLFFHNKVLGDWKKDRTRGGGVLIEQAVHQFDLWRFLLDSEVEEISAHSRAGGADDETATITARMTNGVLNTCLCSWGTGESQEIKIYGEAGILSISGYRFDGLRYYPVSSFPGNMRTRLGDAANFLKRLPSGISAMLQGGGYMASFRGEWRHFLGCIREDQPPESSFEDGRRALAICLAAIDSATSGKAVKIN